MNMDLSPKFPATFTETEAGVYYHWAAADSHVLGEAKVAAGKLVLKPQGFALPHYADCSKVGYVLEGKCGVALRIPGINTKENMGYIGVKKGDVLPIPCGSVSSWYNYGDSDVVIIFMADATKAYVAGEITYFLLTGQQGHLRAFSPEFIAKTYQINADKAKNLVGSQKGVLLIKLSEEEARKIPNPNEEVSNILSHNMDASQPDVEVDNGGKLTTIKGTEFPLLEQVGIDVSRLVLESCATRAPSYATESQVCYIAKGSGEVQIVGINGKLVLNTKVETGQLFVVPKLFAVVVSADEQGIELVSIVTSTRAVVGEIGGKNSVLKTIPSILQMSFNVSQESTQHFLQMLETATILVPAMNLY
ncbi:hypothetical protein Gotri_024766 [Gossypium trilobum]|uniref:Cupin type-1 domain-containing protein n=1 Tax=Gossypium trilobum TaxID=34281 RepID=A0A7J9DNC9_9ROSI|nr:hypothetical protein [Gossypium trilobum]